MFFCWLTHNSSFCHSSFLPIRVESQYWFGWNNSLEQSSLLFKKKKMLIRVKIPSLGAAEVTQWLKAFRVLAKGPTRWLTLFVTPDLEGLTPSGLGGYQICGGKHKYRHAKHSCTESKTFEK